MYTRRRGGGRPPLPPDPLSPPPPSGLLPARLPRPPSTPRPPAPFSTPPLQPLQLQLQLLLPMPARLPPPPSTPDHRRLCPAGLSAVLPQNLAASCCRPETGCHPSIAIHQAIHQIELTSIERSRLSGESLARLTVGFIGSRFQARLRFFFL